MEDTQNAVTYQWLTEEEHLDWLKANRGSIAIRTQADQSHNGRFEYACSNIPVEQPAEPEYGNETVTESDVAHESAE